MGADPEFIYFNMLECKLQLRVHALDISVALGNKKCLMGVTQGQIFDI